MEKIMDEYDQEVYAWYDFAVDCDDGIWIVFISGMTTNSIFCLITLLHLM
jgi:hypothetical protein